MICLNRHGHVLNRHAATLILIAATLAAPTAFAAAADEKGAVNTAEVKAKDLTLQVPDTWKQKPGVREPRVAELQVPAAAGDTENGELAVFYFGPRGAGDVDANVQRWIGQLKPEGRKSSIYTGECPQGKYTLVDLTGTYEKSIGPPVLGNKKTLPGWRVFNVMLETKSGAYFLKLDGPEKTIAAAAEPFRASFGAKKDAEKERPAK